MESQSGPDICLNIYVYTRLQYANLWLKQDLDLNLDSESRNYHASLLFAFFVSEKGFASESFIVLVCKGFKGLSPPPRYYFFSTVLVSHLFSSTVWYCIGDGAGHKQVKAISRRLWWIGCPYFGVGLLYKALCEGEEISITFKIVTKKEKSLFNFWLYIILRLVWLTLK